MSGFRGCAHDCAPLRASLSLKSQANSRRRLDGTEGTGKNSEGLGGSVKGLSEHIGSVIHRLPLGTGDLNRIRAPCKIQPFIRLLLQGSRVSTYEDTLQQLEGN